MIKSSNSEDLLCSALLELAVQWTSQAEIYEAEGNSDCGTGSDVPYALASILRDHATEVERLAYAFSGQEEYFNKETT